MRGVTMVKMFLLFLLVLPAQVQMANTLEPSCSLLKAKNASLSSGHYFIDPDGSGSNAPFRVYCDMQGKNGVGVTVISHDSENRTLVHGFEEPGSYKRIVSYIGARLSQLKQLVDVSTHCEQFIKYECHGAVLFEDGWWVSRDGKKKTYWGGATPESGKCACGMNRTCADPSRGCNCDKNDYIWREDSGPLTRKTDLPVSELRFGDTGYEKEMAYYTLGKLRCFGVVYGLTARVLARWMNGLYYQGQIVNATSQQYHIQYDDGDELWLDYSDLNAVIPDQIPERKEVSKNTRVISNKMGGREDKFSPGTVTKVVTQSPGNTLYKVRFDSAVVSFVPISMLRILPTNSACNGEVAALTGKSGVFVSPSYPNPYPDDSHCSWRITVPKGYRVRLVFTAFELESTYECQYDTVTVRDGASYSSPLLHQFCSTRPPPPVLSTGQNLFVTFVSDGGTSLTGFRAVFEAKPTRNCDNHPAGVANRNIITNFMMASSSDEREPDLGAREGRLNGPRAWCPLTKEAQWLQVDLGFLEYVCGVGTQGRAYLAGLGKWTTMYKLGFSVDKRIWTILQEENEDKVFIANYDPTTVVKQSLLQKVETRFVRFMPVEFYSWPCLRVEVYIQRSCASRPVGVSSRNIISDVMMTSSSDRREPDLTAREGRLNGPYAWCPRTKTGDDWLQVDLGSLEYICGVAIQGKSWGADEWTTEFKMALSRDGKNWDTYEENGNVMLLSGNWDTDSVVENSLKRKKQARFVRFIPVAYHEWPCMRVEVFAENACYSHAVQPLGTNPFRSSSDLSSRYSSQFGDFSSSSIWCPKVNSTREWLELDLEAIHYVCAVSANGTSPMYDGARTAWYKIAGSIDRKLWEMFKSESLEKLFPTEFPLGSNATGERKISLGYLWPTRYVRFFPVNFTKWPCLKVKVYGELVPPPEIITPLTNKTFKAGTTMMLKCLASGYPEPLYSWTRNGSAVMSGVELSEGNTTLVVNNVTKKDAGLFECSAANSLGSVRSRAYIAVQDCISAPIGIWNREIISSTRLTASSSYHKFFNKPNYGRLNGSGAWCPSKLSGQHWLQVDFGALRHVCGVATQGHWTVTNNEYTKKYTISVSRDGVTWSTYKESSATKEFDGNKDTWSVVTQHLAHITEARYIRFYPITFNQYPCLRVEVYAEKEPVKIREGQTSLVARKRSNVKLTCAADGFPSPVFSWTRTTNKGAKLIKSTTSQTLLLTNVQIQDSGIYRCTARNDISSDFTDILLTVQAKPFFSSKLPEVTFAIRGQPVTLCCTAVSFPTGQVTWYKDGKQVTSTGHSNVTVNTAGSRALQSNLTIISAVYQDSGEYSCVVSNVIGTVKADGGLKVHGPPSFIIKPVDVAVVEGASVTLNCQANGLPFPSIFWKFDGQVVSPDDVLSNGSLVLKGVTTDSNHEGQYTCEARNDVGMVAASVLVTIHTLPYFTETPPEHLEIPKGEKLALECVAHGRPEPTLVWTKVGNQITSRDRFYNDSSATMVINKASLEDTGIYACVAQTTAGSTISYTNITVFGKPTIDPQLTVSRELAYLGHQVSLACYVRGLTSIPVNYRWTKDGRPLSQSFNCRISKNIVILTPKRKQDFGAYVCHVWNSAGMVNHSIEVIEVEREEAIVKGRRGQSSSRKWSLNFYLVVPLLLLVVILSACLVALYVRYKKLKRMRRPSGLQLGLLGSETEHEEEKGSQFTRL